MHRRIGLEREPVNYESRLMQGRLSALLQVSDSTRPNGKLRRRQRRLSPLFQITNSV